MDDQPIHAYVSSYSLSAGSDPDQTGLTVFRFDQKTGSLTLVQEVSSAYLSWIDIDPAQRFLYTCSTDMDSSRRIGKIDTYAIDPHTGTLQFLNQVSLGESGPAHLTVSPDGRHMVVANYYYGEYAVLPIGADGRPGRAFDTLKDVGSGPHPRQDGPHPHAVTFDPRGHFIAATDLGTDVVQVLRLTDGRLERVSQTSASPGTGPRHVAFSRDGKVCYVLGELDGNINAFAYDPATGTIGRLLQTVSTQPPDSPGVPSGAEIAVHPSGEYLYASNRGSQTVAGYRIDPATGKLSPISFASQGVNFPTNFAIDPSGRWLYVNSNMGNEIVQFGIDRQTGGLTPTGQTVPMTAPNVMVFCTPGLK